MATKTINLTGAEVAVLGLDGAHAHIRNDSTDTIYAAKTAEITAGADGVASIPAGQSDTLRGISGAVYLLGTGSVLIQSDDYVTSPFKTSTSSGGSGGVDDVARAALTAHESNTQAHINAKERDRWNELGSRCLNINPNFAVNQRGGDVYSSVPYGSEVTKSFTVDCWQITSGITLVATGGGVMISSNSALSVNYAALMQEVPYDPLYGSVTLSMLAEKSHDNAYMLVIALDSGGSAVGQSAKVHIEEGKVTSVTYKNVPEGAVKLRVQVTLNSGTQPSDSLRIKYAKLESGTSATRFVPPDPTSELLKCQRYYQIHSTGDIDPVDLRPNMAEIKDIRQRSDGKYEYISEP